MPRVVRRKLRVVRQRKMGGLGSAASGMPILAGYNVGKELWRWKRKKEPKGSHLVETGGAKERLRYRCNREPKEGV